MRQSIFQCKRISFFGGNLQSTETPATLFVGHTNSTAVGGIRIAIAGIIQIEYLFSEIQPTLFVKIFCVVLADHRLKFTLPVADHFVKGLYCGSEIIGIIVSLLMEVNVNVRQPFV